MKKILFYLSFPFLIIACSSDSDLSARRSEIAPPRTSMAPPPPPPIIEEMELEEHLEINVPMGRNGPIKNSTFDRKIIRTIHARFQTEDLNSTTTYLEGLTKEYNGLIINMNHTNSKHEFNNRIHLSIPSEKLEAFLGNLKPRSIHTDYMRVNAEDVTEEFVDISSRETEPRQLRIYSMRKRKLGLFKKKLNLSKVG